MIPEPYSESDTRQQLIDQRLRLAGWGLDDPTQVGVNLVAREQDLIEAID